LVDFLSESWSRARRRRGEQAANYAAVLGIERGKSHRNCDGMSVPKAPHGVPRRMPCARSATRCRATPRGGQRHAAARAVLAGVVTFVSMDALMYMSGVLCHCTGATDRRSAAPAR